MVSNAQFAVTPEGSPDAVPIPVAPEVAILTFTRGKSIHCRSVEGTSVNVLTKVTVILPLALRVSQPPVRGIK